MVPSHKTIRYFVMIAKKKKKDLAQCSNNQGAQDIKGKTLKWGLLLKKLKCNTLIKSSKEKIKVRFVPFT